MKKYKRDSEMTKGQGKTRKLKPSQKGWMVWQWKNKHRTLRIPRWIAEQYSHNIGTDMGVAMVNSKVESTVGPLGFTAWKEIREALTYEGLVQIGACIVDPDHVRSTGDEAGIRFLLIMSRYEQWRKRLAKDRKTMEVVELFVKTFPSAREVERAVKIRNGTAVKRLVKGLECYVAILREEKGYKPKLNICKEKKKLHGEFVWTRIVNRPQGTIKKKSIAKN